MNNAFSPLNLIQQQNPTDEQANLKDSLAFSPAQIIKHNEDTCPFVEPEVISTLNQLIKKNFSGNSFIIKIKDVMELLATEYPQISISPMKQKNIITIYKIAQWDIYFDYPDIDQNYGAFIKFDKQKTPYQATNETLQFNFSQLKLKPISYSEAQEHYVNSFPKEVFIATNKLLKEKFISPDKSIRITRNELLKELYNLYKIEPENDDNQYYLRNLPLETKDINIEDVYNQRGWKVVYDKPGYNETYDGFWIFTAKPNYS